MGTLTDRLEQIGDKARKILAAKDAARERAIPLSRDAIRYSTDAIRAIHRGEFEKGRELLDTARLLLRDLDKALSEHQELCDAGFVYNAQKEYVEGCITHALIAGVATFSIVSGEGRWPAARSCYRLWMTSMGCW